VAAWPGRKSSIPCLNETIRIKTGFSRMIYFASEDEIYAPQVLVGGAPTYGKYKLPRPEQYR